MAKQAQLDEVRPALNKVNKGISKVEKVLDVVEAGADKATDIIEGGLETVADVVPETLDAGVHVSAEGTRRIVRLFSHPKAMAASLTVGGGVIGAGLGVGGYFLLKKRLERKMQLAFEAKLDAEIEKMRIFYTRRDKRGRFATPADAAETLGAPKVSDVEAELVEEAADALDEYQSEEPPPGLVDEDPREGKNHRTRYDKIRVQKTPVGAAKVIEVVQTTEPVEDEPVSRNVFDARRNDGWNQELEEASRDENLPYIISHDEHEENAFAHEQTTLTYYAADGILADERDQPIEDAEALVGAENLAMFGHGSRSEDTLYVRNEPRELDLEIVRRGTSFGEEVMGFVPGADE